MAIRCLLCFCLFLITAWHYKDQDFPFAGKCPGTLNGSLISESPGGEPCNATDVSTQLKKTHMVKTHMEVCRFFCNACF